MRKQIAAANWKMNLNYQQAEKLLDDILSARISLKEHQQVIFAVPYPYLIMAKSEIADEEGYAIAAQNCSDKLNGAYTGEVSVEMLRSIGISYCILGHSERREYFLETNKLLADKINICLSNKITPIFCCGEPLAIRDKGTQNEYVQQQLTESLFHLNPDQIKNIIIAYEPIWAIGTGKTATTAQTQEMHAHLRSVLGNNWGKEVADEVSILYGGSVKANNAAELFESPDVDGGLVGGASLISKDFIEIIKALKK
ncbi:MAG TPA: triose-phosphate isomerase [Flavisolibacter sp.]|jgi:triosephosphate isomerase|nr:triose-phosphate isomerase [Flavisolibacter sp.]